MAQDDDSVFELDLTRGVTKLRPRKRRESKGSDASWYYFGIVGQIGFSIAIPIAGGAIVGSMLDERWSTYPRYTLGLLGIGVVISFITFYQAIRTVLRSTKQTERHKK